MKDIQNHITNYNKKDMPCKRLYLLTHDTNRITILNVTNLTDRNKGGIFLQHKNEKIYDLIEKFIDCYHVENGVIPTNIEISKGTELSTATVSRYISKMVEDGRIIVDGHRSIKTQKMQKKISSTRDIPIVGAVACGSPLLAEQNINGYVTFPSNILGNGEYFFLMAKGDSMIDVGISDGDLVLIEQKDCVCSGEIAVALIDNEATLKRVFYESDNKIIRLHPENENMDDIYVDNCIIQGIAKKVLKDIK